MCDATFGVYLACFETRKFHRNLEGISSIINKSELNSCVSNHTQRCRTHAFTKQYNRIKKTISESMLGNGTHASLHCWKVEFNPLLRVGECSFISFLHPPLHCSWHERQRDCMSTTLAKNKNC